MGGITGVLILIIVVLIFTGKNKLPELGEGLGRTVRNFRRSMSEPDEVDITPRKKPGKDGPEPPRQ
ncbi:MAG: twin-arginine translocase TatA/TatE family subunit [Proteobacteria bacterium]|nr:twin-arginine translocase TatA/TatE family subunit [Pseudomonadota bacterium]MBU1594744.1 twin-arginine translocase TatA/TatE family subunit [Pseudomonadota bacterium]